MVNIYVNRCKLKARTDVLVLADSSHPSAKRAEGMGHPRWSEEFLRCGETAGPCASLRMTIFGELAQNSTFED